MTVSSPAPPAELLCPPPLPARTGWGLLLHPDVAGPSRQPSPRHVGTGKPLLSTLGPPERFCHLLDPGTFATQSTPRRPHLGPRVLKTWGVHADLGGDWAPLSQGGRIILRKVTLEGPAALSPGTGAEGGVSSLTEARGRHQLHHRVWAASGKVPVSRPSAGGRLWSP